MLTDPIADLLTRIRNAKIARHRHLSCPASRLKARICNVLQAQGYIRGFAVEKDNRQGMIHIDLKYGDDNECVITGLKRVSKPGRRVYCKHESLPRVLNGLGIAILSTSKGVLTDRDARKERVGGEYLCAIW